MSLKRKKIYISVVLVAAFFLIAVLMTSSVNLFSLSYRNNKVEYKDLLKNINASSVASFLSSKDKLKLINYFYEYQKLKAKVKSLSYDELNRFLFLGKYLAKYIEPRYLGMSKEVVDSVLSRYGEVANKGIISGVNKNLDIKVNLLKQVMDLKDRAKDLYDANKISRVAYQEILTKLSDIEYNINLSSFGSKDVQVDLNDIIKVINKEKASYSINADLSVFDDFEGSLGSLQKEMDSMKYISDFVNSSIDSVGQGDIPGIWDADKIKMEQFSAIINNIDSETFGDILDIIKKDDARDVEVGDIDFAKTMKFPNITVEGSLEDAWNINFDASSLNLDNLLTPIDVSLLSDKSLDNIARSITRVKVPGIYQGDINVPGTTPTTSPGNTIAPDPISTISPSPSITPDVTTKPSVTPSITPDVSDRPTDSPSESSMPVDTPTNSPIESTLPSENVPKLWNIYYKAVIKVLIVVLVGMGTVILIKYIKDYKRSKKKIIYEGSDNLKDMQSNIEKIPISYKERLIELGLDVLCRMSTACIKDKRERTPREIVNIFLDEHVRCDKKVLESFLECYESALFYKLEVDVGVYENFVEVCNVIYGILSKEEEGIT